MTDATLMPAYGRDYTSKAALLVDLWAGKDFVCRMFEYDRDIYANLADLKHAGLGVVKVRYNKLRKVAMVDLNKAPKAPKAPKASAADQAAWAEAMDRAIRVYA